MSDAATVNVPTKRVAKACDNCRAKKIKCNGVEPCVNCEKSSLQCAYTYVIKKRQAAPTRVSNRKLLSDLSARLARLEQLLSEVAPKLQEHEGALSVRDEAEEDVKSSQSAGEYSEESEPEDIGLGGSPEDNRKELCMLMCGEGISPFVDDSVSSMGSTSANGLVLEDGIVDEKIDDYCAVHTSATLFSRKGLSFLHKSLGGNDEHVLPLVRLHNVVKRNVALFTKKFFSITAMDDLPPWPDVEDRKELYKQFAGNFLLAYPVLQSDEVQLLGMKLCVPYLEELNVTEQLLASAICLLGASVKGYVDPYSVEKWQEISNNMLVRTLNILQTTWMTTVPDPLNYIQGIILLCLYIENSTIPRSTYVQIAFAIRLGQSLGIHRRETYSSFKDPVERSRRLNVWWWCYRYDRMLSVCAGKPSLIHEHDNTAFDDWNVYQVLRWRLYRDPSYQAEKPTDLDLPKKLTELLLYASSNSLTDLDFALNYYLQKLYNIQGDAYNKLFCNKSMMEKNIRKRISNVRRILKRLDRWEASLPEILRSNKNHDSEQISLLQEKLSNMRKEGEDKMLSTAILSRILLLYIKYSLTRSNVSCAALPLPSPFPSSSAPLKDIPKMFSSFSYSVEHSLYVLKLVDCILQRDCNSHLSIDPLFAYMWAFLSVIGSMFTFDNFSRDTIILLEKYAQTVIGIAKQRKGLFACKWTSVALVAMHFLRVVIDNFNEKCASPCPLSTSTELPIDPQPYISAFDSLQKFLGATCESFATEDNDPPLSGCVGTNSNSASQQCNNLFEPNLPGSNKWSSRTTPSTSYLDNSQSNQPNNAFFQQCPGYNSNTDRSTSDRANLSECPPIANDDDMPLYENDPNAIVEQVLSNLELDINFDGVSANGYLLKMPYYLS